MSTFDRALAESRLGTYAELSEGTTNGFTYDRAALLADLAGELAASLEEALDVIENVMRAVAPADRQAAPANEVRVQMPQWPSPEKAWVVEQREGGYVILPCPREQADNAIGSVDGDDLTVGLDTFEEAAADALHGHPAKRHNNADMAAYIRQEIDGSFTIAL